MIITLPLGLFISFITSFILLQPSIPLSNNPASQKRLKNNENTYKDRRRNEDNADITLITPSRVNVDKKLEEIKHSRIKAETKIWYYKKNLFLFGSA